MLVLTSWEERSIFLAHLFNPAFCGEIIRYCALAYTKEKKQNFPFILIFLVLPIILQKERRDKLPKKVNNLPNSLKKWITNNINEHSFFEDTKQLIPFTREAISFLDINQAITISIKGELHIHKYKDITSLEVQKYFDKAKILGRFFAKEENPLTIYTMFNLKP